MESVNQVQILDEAICVSLHANAVGKGINPSGLLLAIDKTVGKTDFFSLDKATSLGEGQL